MAFEIVESPQFRPQRTPANGFHFWQVTCEGGDLESDWQPTGFAAAAQDVSIFSTDGVSSTSAVNARIELNAEPVTIIGDTGTHEYKPGHAWRVVKGVGAGVFRVRVGYFASTWFEGGQ